MTYKGLLVAAGLFLAACSTTPPVPPPQLSPSKSAEVVPGEFIVRFTNTNELKTLSVGGLSLESVRTIGEGEVLYRTKDKASVGSTDAILTTLKNRRDVVWAQPNYIVHPFGAPNDPLLSSQAFHNVVGARPAWDINGGSGPIIAVLDSGSSPHPDLQWLPGYDFSPTTFDTCDGNGYDSDPYDACKSGHGTSVAGVAAATSNNGFGVAGTCVNCRVLPVRVLPGNVADVALAIRWAAGIDVGSGIPINANPAKIINLSLGSATSCVNTPAYTSAIDAVTARGVIVVAAAGNENADASNFTPASCNNVVTVGAVNLNRTRSVWGSGSSNYGSMVDVSGVGGNYYPTAGSYTVKTTWNGDTPVYGYGDFFGTSSASPQISGVLGMLVSQNPNLNINSALSSCNAQLNHSLQMAARKDAERASSMPSKP
jgi:serine protease